MSIQYYLFFNITYFQHYLFNTFIERDQVRAEQLTLESSNTANRRMQESLDVLKSDADRSKISRDLEGKFEYFHTLPGQETELRWKW